MAWWFVGAASGCRRGGGGIVVYKGADIVSRRPNAVDVAGVVADEKMREEQEAETVRVVQQACSPPYVIPRAGSTFV